MSFKYSTDYSQFTLIGNRHRMLNSHAPVAVIFIGENAVHTTPNNPKYCQLSQSHLAKGKLTSL